MTDARITALTERNRRHLDELCTHLRDELGDALRSIMVYGSLARGGFDSDRSDIDLAIVLTDDRRELLQRVGTALELARHAARIEAILLRADELQSAADVFPLLYDDIRGCHIVLHGDNPFASLRLLDEHRRLRIEQELREARIRLRRVLAETCHTPLMLAGAVERKLKQLRGPLHALLVLRGRSSADDLPAVLAACAEHLGLDLAALARVREAPTAAYDNLVCLLDAAIARVDIHRTGGCS